MGVAVKTAGEAAAWLAANSWFNHRVIRSVHAAALHW